MATRVDLGKVIGEKGGTYTKQEIIDMIYPVGAIYMSVSSVSPETIFGGTWQAWCGGRVPIGVYRDDPDFNAAEKSGGEKTHTLTVDEIPNHSHSLNKNQGNLGYYDGTGNNYKYQVGWNIESRRTDVNLMSGYVGGGKDHNNLPPYLTCYMWKRIA